jgi:hypothetical protein
MTVGRIPSVEGGIQPTLLDAKGDLITATAADTPARLALGTTGQVLKVNTATATGLEWATDSAGMTNPMTTTGDTIYSSSGSTPARLGIGTAGQILQVNSGATAPEWVTPAGSLANYALIGSVTSLSGTTTTISGISGKDSLFIRIANYKAGSNAVFELTFNSDSGTNYIYNEVEKNGTSAVSFNSATGDTKFRVGGSGGTNTMETTIVVFGCGSTGVKPTSFTGAINNGSGNLSTSANGVYIGTSAITSVSITSTVSSFTQGTIAVYGA